MSLITQAKHRNFQDYLQLFIESASKKIEKNETAFTSLQSLNEELEILDTIFEELNSKTNELRMLIKKYNDTQKRTRIMLRQEKIKYEKIFGPISFPSR